ncbi:hypothetical protein EXT73_21190 [Pectobacterium atrosepticum]|nr:hypothetical protein CVS35_08215 [Pectobacterium atrosepticum]MCL6392961.1 hypothetical protein [Pectobacterium atrosepticum]PWD64308.1 hypothetical protein DF214_04715 [Pectobacterium atrosepticum]QXE16874.1 hypothetical protein DCX48_21575 [Pectobacterium atrosepticum]
MSATSSYGRPHRYAELAIPTVLMLKRVFCLTLPGLTDKVLKNIVFHGLSDGCPLLYDTPV